MATDARAGSAGLALGGILVIAGIVIAIVWSVWLGIILAVLQRHAPSRTVRNDDRPSLSEPD